MKTVVLVLIALVISTVALCQWNQCNGPYGGNIEFIAQNRKTNTLFAGSKTKGLYRFKTSNNRWESLSDNFQSLEFYVIASLDSLIFVINSIYGIFKSADDGDTWVSVPLNAHSCFYINAQDFSSDDATLVLKSTCGVYFSTSDSTFSLFDSNSIPDILSADRRVYVAAFRGRLFASYTASNNYNALSYSDDWGINWKRSNLSISWPNYFHDPPVSIKVNYNKLFYGGASLISDDLGVTWTDVTPTGIGFGTWNAIYASIDNDTILISNNYQNGYAYISFNSGNTYTQINGQMKINQLRKYPPYGLLTATAFGIFRSQDSGLTWNDFNYGLTAIGYDYITRYRDALFVGCGTSELFASNDEGNTWVKRNSGVDTFSYSPKIDGFASIDNRIILSSFYHGIYYSNDGGITWTNIPQGSAAPLSEINVDNGKLYARSYSNIISSDDKGITWYVAISNSGPCTMLGLTVKNDIILSPEFCRTGGLGQPNSWVDLIRSDDAGATLSYQPIPFLFRKTDILGSRAFGIDGSNNLAKSDDQGITWYVDSTLNQQGFSGIYTIDSSFVFIGTPQGKIFFSSDTGETWIDVTGNFEGIPQKFFHLGQNIYVTTSINGIWKLDVSNTGIPNNYHYLGYTALVNSYNIQIYPNPARDKINIVLPVEWIENSLDVKIYNITGTLVLQTTVEHSLDNNIELNFGTISKGIYCLVINGDANTICRKIILE